MRLFRHLLSTSSLTLVSRIFGLIRDVTIASVFGAGLLTDAFVLAFRIPNLFRAFFAEGAFSQAFVPTLSGVQQRSPEDEKRFINHTFGLLALGAGILAIAGSVFAPQLVALFAQGYSGEQLQLVGTLLRITFPYIFFISLTALAASVLQCHNHFFIPAFAPVLLNLSLIFFALVLAQYFAVPIESLAWAIVVAGVLQFAIQYLPLARIKRIPLPILSFRDPDVRKMLLLMLPIVLSSSITQISLAIDSLLATYLEPGTVFWLYLGNRVVGLPLGIFGVSIAIIVLPSLSRFRASGNQAAYRNTLQWGIHLIFLISIPATLALIVLAQPIITMLFHYNKFDSIDVMETAVALQIYAIGLCGFMLVKVLVNAFLANSDAKNPVRCILIASSSNIALSISLMPWLGFVGLALSTSLSALLNVVLLYAIGRRKGYFEKSSGVLLPGVRIVCASVAMAALLYWLMPAPQEWFGYQSLVRVWNMSYLVIAGIVSYFAVMLVTGWRWRSLTIESETHESN